MKPAPLLLTLGFAFWGWQTGLWVATLLLALAVESPRLIGSRWDLEERDFQRVADLCSLAFAATLIYLAARTRPVSGALLSVLTWLPMIFAPLILAQRYSSAGRVPLSALFWSLRRQRPRDGQPPRTARLDHAYFVLCLLAASAANQRSAWFFLAVLVLGAYALWPVRAAGRVPVLWPLALAAAGILAYALQHGLVLAQGRLEEAIFALVRERYFGHADPWRARTAIGDIGTLKFSDRILVRVAADRGTAAMRLRDATYNVYSSGAWSAVGAQFQVAPSVGSDWMLGLGDGRAVSISSWLTERRAVLALPLGTYRLDALNVGRVERNPLGAVRVEEGPELLSFRARVDAIAQQDAPPDGHDLAVPPTLDQPLTRALAEAGGTGPDARATIERVTRFFGDRFSYSLELGTRQSGGRSLVKFLLEDRRGHCEYFASATALMLRKAGVPARYATGYVVEEFSPLEDQYLVRARHAHAWVLAWLGGRWQEIDTTPVVWLAEEAKQRSALQPLSDLFSALWYRYSRWRWSGEESAGPSWTTLSVVVPLALYLLWSLSRRRRVDRSASESAPQRAARSGADPMLTAILVQVAQLGFTRPPGTPLRAWAATLGLPDQRAQELLRRIVERHYRRRFDPAHDASAPDHDQQRDARELLALLSRQGMQPET